MNRFASIVIAALPFIFSACAITKIGDRQYQDAKEHPQSACVDGFGFNSQFKDRCTSYQVLADFTRLTIEYQQHAPDNPDLGLGEHFDESQVDTALNTIEKAQSQDAGVFVVFYVHGWHHNASDNDDNFKKFDLMLARVRDQLDRNGRNRTALVGIYAGWQGESVEGGLSSILSIGDRAAAADVVATGKNDGIDCKKKSALYLDLKKIAERLERNKSSRLLVIGHSLGGRILSTTFSCDLQNPDILRPLNEQSTIVTVNAAVDAGVYEPLFSQSAKPDKNLKPYWINFTSRDDLYTNQVFSIASHIGLVKSLSHPKDSTSNVAIGHYKPYVTHTLDLVYSQLDPCKVTDGQFICGPDVKTGPKKSGAWCESRFGRLDEISSCRIWALPKGFPRADAFGYPFEFNEAYFASKDQGYNFQSTPYDSTGWFQPTTVEKLSFPIVFRERNVNYVNNQTARFAVDAKDAIRNQHIDAQIFLTNFRQDLAWEKIPMKGRMWNIQTTDNVIDYAGQQDDYFGTGKHSAYVSTFIYKLLTELAIAPISP
nr:hypothetical protein [Herbaspirillum sp. ASV7]